MANNLKYSDSPYLLQHKDNPVEWQIWSDKIFQKAKKENKLIFLSIGYSTCHWCHVMERESFENEKIAEILNKNFISIKVDKEEYPDIDKYYQNIYQIMHNRAGGWPLTIIMTPDKKVFYSATYIPPHVSQYGVGLEELLKSISNDWHTNPNKILNIANSLQEYLQNQTSKPIVKIDNNIINKLILRLDDFDKVNGGLKGSPKFPMESTLDVFLDIYLLTKNKEILKNIDFTLQKMAKGGIFDQIEGGFYRYSTDTKWLIPHFEKMLYNNANLSSLYLKAYKITKNELYKEVAFRTINEMLNRYRDKNGLFFSASNAESEGSEGRYFVYYYDEVLPKFEKFSNKNELLNYFGIKKYGEFNGKNNPIVNGDKPNNYKKALEILQKIRNTKEFPFIDTKKLTSWNAMMIIALFEAGCYDKKYTNEAINTLDILLKEMYDTKLYHSYNKNKLAKTPALLEDYAYLIKSLISAYNHTFDEKYLQFAKKLSQEVDKFYNKEWYMNENNTIKADFSDSAYSSSLAVLANDFFDLATIDYNYDLWQKGVNIVKIGSFYINQYPAYYPTLTKAYLKTKYDEYIITSQDIIICNNFNYPFIVFKKGESFELCTIKNCIKQTKNLKEIKFLLENIKN